MAARSSGNKKPAGTRSKSGSGSTAKGGKDAAGKSGKTKKSSTGKTQKADSKAKPKKAGSTKSKASSTKSKTPKKSTSSKKRTSRKAKSKPSFLQRHKSYLLGVSLGLLIGGLGAVAVLYYPLITQWMDRASSPGVVKTESPETIPKPSPSLEYLYEESNELDTMVRKLDQALYKGLGAARIPDRNIQFIKVSHKYSRDRHWEHADIEVELPKGVKLKQVVRAVEKELGSRQFNPKPMLITTARNGVLIADIRQDGLNTHTVTLIPTEGDYVMEEEPSSKTKPPAGQVKPRKKPRRAKTARQATSPPGPKPKVAIIIDDFGQQLNGAKCFIDLKLPVAVAVLPFLPHTRDVAQKASVAGKTVLVHLPMQPAGWPEIKPGPGALMVGMERPQIQRRVADALGAVPNAKGVNNHMGSRFTEDKEKMGWVLESLKRKGMFYVDSRTSMRSVAYDTARQLGLKTGQRAVFLDNVPQPEAIRMQLMKLVARARQDGQAVGIGHVYPVTCQVLKSEYNHLKSKVDFVPITALVK